MTHDVFISYSTKDKALANKICAFLESKKNISCWIAHRDIVPGADWPEAIVNAITASRIMVLVFTHHANESAQMARELARADSQPLPVIALRTSQELTPGKKLAYFLSTSHWMDIFPPPLEQHLAHLGDVIQNMLGGQPPPPHPAGQDVNRRLLLGAGAAGAVVIGAGSWWSFSRSRTGSPVLAGQVPPETPAGNGTSDPNKLSVTVLPFKNLTNDSAQEYFSDGQTDAIVTALVQLRGLTMVAPQSAFLLGKREIDLPTIGALLHVNYVLDGTVNRADKLVRVVARLIHVATNRIAWAGSFNRQIENVLMLQDDVAQLIASGVQGALKLPGITPARAQAPTLSNEGGTLFLQGKSQLRQRAQAEPGGPLTTAAELFEGVLRQSPNFLPAQALLVQVYGFIAAYHALFSTDGESKLRNFNDTWLSKADQAAVKATALAPDNPISLVAMGLAQNFRGKLAGAEENFKRAYAPSPSNTDILHLYSLFLLNVGHVRQADAMRKKLQVLEPLVAVYVGFNMTSAWVSGDSQRALKVPGTSMMSVAPTHPFFARQLALIHASQGRFREASEAVLRAAATYDAGMVKAASELLLAAGSGKSHDAPDLGFFNMLHVYSKTPERALDYFLTNLRAGFWPASETPQFWHPSKAFVALRRTPQFRSMIGETGLLEFWRTKGKPDLCAGSRAEDFCGA